MLVAVVKEEVRACIAAEKFSVLKKELFAVNFKNSVAVFVELLRLGLILGNGVENLNGEVKPNENVEEEGGNEMKPIHSRIAIELEFS